MKRRRRRRYVSRHTQTHSNLTQKNRASAFLNAKCFLKRIKIRKNMSPLEINSTYIFSTFFAYGCLQISSWGPLDLNEKTQFSSPRLRTKKTKMPCLRVICLVLATANLAWPSFLLFNYLVKNKKMTKFDRFFKITIKYRDSGTPCTFLKCFTWWSRYSSGWRRGCCC